MSFFYLHIFGLTHVNMFNFLIHANQC